MSYIYICLTYIYIYVCLIYRKNIYIGLIHIYVLLCIYIYVNVVKYYIYILIYIYITCLHHKLLEINIFEFEYMFNMACDCFFNIKNQRFEQGDAVFLR